MCQEMKVDHKDKTLIVLGVDVDKNIPNIKWVSV